MKDLKRVYQAPTKEIAKKELSHLREKWYARYPIVIKSWENRWDNLSTYFAYTPEIRKLIYTINSVEAPHRQLNLKRFSQIACPDCSGIRRLKKCSF